MLLFTEIIDIYNENYIKPINIKSTLFWDIKQCSSLKINRRFGKTCHLHLLGPKISRERNQRESRRQAEPLLNRLNGVSTLHNHRCENLNPHKYLCGQYERSLNFKQVVHIMTTKI
jgi:hypothetical protein